MTELQRKLDEVRALTASEVSEPWIDLTMREARRRRTRRTRARIAVAATACALLLAGVVLTRRPAPQSNMTFADGSVASVLTPGTQLRLLDSTDEVIEVSLERGRSRFAVTKKPHRKFRVHVGAVTVEVLGTRFVVQRDATQVEVSVEEGRVRVLGPGGEQELGAGESARLAPVAPSPAVAPSATPKDTAEPASEPEEEAPSANERPASQTPAWRTSAARGNYRAAFGQLRAAGRSNVRDVPEELMLAADVARWSEHPAAAVPYLERVVSDHRRDPRSQLAAFTLGRVYLEELGKPREAASAFARARSLDPKGALAADALAREVEAWSRAGEPQRALAAAEDYLRRYPDGTHAAAVRRFGGLE